MRISEWLPPILVAAGLAAIGWLLRYVFTSIIDKLDDLEATFTRVTGKLESDHLKLANDLKGLDRRVIRLESWRDLLELLEQHGHGN